MFAAMKLVKCLNKIKDRAYKKLLIHHVVTNAKLREISMKLQLLIELVGFV